MPRIADVLAVDRDAPSEYIVTDRLRGEFERLSAAIETARKSPGERAGIWISGPAGCGKSSFAARFGRIFATLERQNGPPNAVFSVHLQADLRQEAWDIGKALLQGVSPDLDTESALSADECVQKALDYCEIRCPGKAPGFILDEIGTFALLGPRQFENLRRIVEQFGKESFRRFQEGSIPAPAWIVITSRDALPEVSKNLAATRTSSAAAKLEDCFAHHVELEAGDMRAVLAAGILRKNEASQPLLRQLFRDSLGEGEAEFVALYPYPPRLIDLYLAVMAGIRRHPNTPHPANGNGMSVVRQAFEMLFSDQIRFAEQPVGRLVSIDKLYDVLEANIEPDRRQKVRSIEQRFTDGDGFAGRVAKAICLMEFAGLARTADDIAGWLVGHVAEEPPVFEVARSLERLEEAHFVRQLEDGWHHYDFDDVLRRALALKHLEKTVGVVNPRLPGTGNDLIQLVKKPLARLLNWYNRPLFEFNSALRQSLEEVVWAVDHLVPSLAAVDREFLGPVFERLPVDTAALERQLVELGARSAPVAAPMREKVDRLRQQVKELADLQQTADGERAPERTKTMRWQGVEFKDRTAYVIGLFGTGRRYINELLLDNTGERAKYFRDTIRLHPGPTPMIYSGHVTRKYVSRSQETPPIMRCILESVHAGFADLIFVYRHPLDSLLTNWVWWRTFLRDGTYIAGISQVYEKTGDLCADLEQHFDEFLSFAQGDPGFFAASPGPRFLSFAEFVEETELHMESAMVSLRLEDFVADPRGEFGKILKVMSLDADLTAAKLAAPRSKPYGYLTVQDRVPKFREFIDRLAPETRNSIKKIGYAVK